MSVNWLKRIKGDLHENEPGAINQDASTVDSFGGISLVIPESFTQNDGVKVNLIEWERVRLEKLRGTSKMCFLYVKCLSESVPPNPSIDPHLQHLDSDDIGLNVDDEKSLPDVITSMKSQVCRLFCVIMSSSLILVGSYLYLH